MGYAPGTESRKTAEPGTESSLSEEEMELLADLVEASELASEDGSRGIDDKPC